MDEMIDLWIGSAGKETCELLMTSVCNEYEYEYRTEKKNRHRTTSLQMQLNILYSVQLIIDHS